LLTDDEYKTFGLPFDKQCLDPAKPLWCNLLHLHGLNIYFELITQYSLLGTPFPILNWHDRETPPSLREAQTSEVLKTSEVSPTLCGGISQKTIVLGSSREVQAEAEDAIQQTKGRRFILGTGCVVPVIAPHGNLLSAKKSVEDW